MSLIKPFAILILDAMSNTGCLTPFLPIEAFELPIRDESHPTSFIPRLSQSREFFSIIKSLAYLFLQQY